MHNLSGLAYAAKTKVSFLYISSLPMSLNQHFLGDQFQASEGPVLKIQGPR